MMPRNKENQPCPNRVLIVAQPTTNHPRIAATAAARILNECLWATKFMYAPSEESQLGLGCVIDMATDLETVTELLGSYDRIIYVTTPNYGFVHTQEVTAEEYNACVALHSFCVALSTASDKCHIVHLGNSRQDAVNKIVDIITENWNV